MSVLGDAVGALALCAVGAAAWVTARRPFLGLGFLVAGMAFHNFLIMVLLRLGANHLLIRAVQSWKEALVALLVAVAAWRLYRARSEGWLSRLTALDWLAAAFFALMVLYLAVPSWILHGHSGFVQRLAAFRIAAYIPILYALGRTLEPPSGRDIRQVVWIILGAGAIVGAFGLVELFLVPTRTWIDWGVNDFSAWLGFQYKGPGHMPENFFQTLPSGLYLRRMASTYLGPLGIAYTGLLVFPLSVAFIDRLPRRSSQSYLALAALAFLVAGILFSVTRLAMFLLAAEAIVLALAMPSRRLTATTGLIVVATVVVLIAYPQVGPAVDANLVPGGPNRGSILTTGDPSLLEHLKTLQADVKVAIRHPLGEGLGSAGSSANRFGPNTSDPDYAPGESAVLTTFVDTGLLGGIAYVALFLLAIAQSFKALMLVGFRSIEAALPMTAVLGGLALIPVTMTSDVWGDLSVLFLFWWAVGTGASLAASRELVAGANVGGWRRLRMMFASAGS